MNIEQQHTEMVGKLFKDGIAIAETLTYNKIGDLHATLGIVGETGELYFATVNDDKENVIEELGDLFFYTDRLINSLGLKFIVADGTNSDTIEIIAAELMYEATELTDLIKKGVIYNQDYNIDQINGRMAQIHKFANMVMAHYGVDKQTVLKANMDKLIGPNGRYPDAEYSDQAAHERADKKDSE